ncbi:hypothetical protein [Methanorbis furvi]|uniref:hypothetical protein n=1 Tax=Methanorbis furvi TaxID=3028299 RepID=UPI0030B883A5
MFCDLRNKYDLAVNPYRRKEYSEVLVLFEVVVALNRHDVETEILYLEKIS